MQLEQNANAGLSRGWAIVLFAVMCTVWGVTWIAIHAGVTALPPIFFAASRFLAAGPILLAMARLSGHRLATPGHGSRLVVTALLSNTFCYAPAFWAVRYLPTGFSAIVNLALTPLAIFAIAVALRQDRFSWARFVAVALGVAGIVVMFEGRSTIDPSPEVLAAAAAIVLGTLSFCLGSVLTRPLARDLPAFVVAGWHCVIGGTGLALLSLATEAPTLSLFAAFAEWRVLAGWAFLVIGGSIVAYTIYLRLLVVWGPTNASSYSFVSPAIAAVVGAVALGERYTATEGVGALVMMAATVLMLRTAR